MNESLRASLAGVARKLCICLTHFERAIFFLVVFFFPSGFFVLGFGTCGSLVATIASTAKFPRPSLPLASDFVGPC